MLRNINLIWLVLVLFSPFPASEMLGQELPRSGVVEMGSSSVSPLARIGEWTEANVNVTQNVQPQNETSIAYDPNNLDNLVGGTNDYRYNGNADAGYEYSFDGGATWYANTLDAYDTSYGKYSYQGDPAIAAYRDGVFYYAFIDFNRIDQQNRLAVAKTTDGGVNWPQLGVIIDHQGSGNHDFEDKEYIAVDNTNGDYDGYVYVSWTRFPVSGSKRILFSRSTNGGSSFSTPIQISDTSGEMSGSMPAVGPDGEVYVVWQWASTLRIDKSTNGGVTWGTDKLVASIDPIPSPLPGASFRVNSYPSITIDHSDGSFKGYLYVVWADDTGPASAPDILFTRSTDEGDTWSSPIRISDDTNQSYQWFPWISVFPQGNIDVVFFDRRDDPNSTRYHTYRTRSTNGGQTFASNVRVTDAISDAEDDGFNGGFIGDYNGIASTPNKTHPFWTDVRSANSNAEGYTSSVSILPGDLYLKNHTFDSQETFEASATITAGPNLTVESTADVILTAGASITLSPGFIAENGCDFHATINSAIAGNQNIVQGKSASE